MAVIRPNNPDKWRKNRRQNAINVVKAQIDLSLDIKNKTLFLDLCKDLKELEGENNKHEN